jgi:phosphinothricin acetyltransferase
MHDMRGEVLTGINRLLPMLSKTAKPLTSHDLYQIINSQTTIFMAFDDEGPEPVVGMASMVVAYQTVGIVCHVEDVVVDEACRGQHIGKKLMQALIDALPEGWRQLDLTSKPDRGPAHELYLKLGFEQRETGNFRLKPKV